MKLSFAYIITGILTGLIVLVQFIAALPDGSLTMTVCDVGQGDAIYIRLPDGRDMLIDGGPGEKVLSCLGTVMPVFDRTIDLAVLTHPDSDHLSGMVSVLSRYRVGQLVRSDVATGGETYGRFAALVSQKHIAQTFVTAGDTVDIGAVRLRILWPSAAQVASMADPVLAAGQSGDVLGTATGGERNMGSVVMHLSYGKFDALLPGDADNRVDPMMEPPEPADGILEVYKVPHHGARTAVTQDYLSRMTAGSQSVAVVSVGRNSYGHPAPETLRAVTAAGWDVRQTVTDGTLTVRTDGERVTVSGSREAVREGRQSGR